MRTHVVVRIEHHPRKRIATTTTAKEAAKFDTIVIPVSTRRIAFKYVRLVIICWFVKRIIHVIRILCIVFHSNKLFQ